MSTYVLAAVLFIFALGYLAYEYQDAQIDEFEPIDWVALVIAILVGAVVFTTVGLVLVVGLGQILNKLVTL